MVMHVSTCLDQPLVASYTDLMNQTLITFFGCLIPVFIYNAHAYATSLFHTDYWNRVAFIYLSWRVSCCDYRLWWWILYSVILIGMMWIDLSLCNVICVDALGQPFSCRAPTNTNLHCMRPPPCSAQGFCLYGIVELKRMLGYLPIVLHVFMGVTV